MKKLVILGLVTVLVSGCGKNALIAAQRIAGTGAAIEDMGASIQAQNAGLAGQYAQPAYVPPVTFGQPQTATQPAVRTVWVDTGNGQVRYYCTGTGNNTRCWE